MTPAERSAFIDRYANGPTLLEAAFTKFPVEARQWRPAPGKWSAHEIIVHCADSEANAHMRIRFLVTEKEPLIVGYVAGTNPLAVVAVDLNKDNKPDLVAGNKALIIETPVDQVGRRARCKVAAGRREARRHVLRAGGPGPRTPRRSRTTRWRLRGHERREPGAPTWTCRRPAPLRAA